jgi:hypothetical protein
VVGFDDRVVAAGGRVGEADGVAGDGAHGGGGGACEAAGARGRQVEGFRRRAAWGEGAAEVGEGFM